MSKVQVKMIKNSKNFLAILILSLIILAAIIFLAKPLIFQCLEIYKQNKDKQVETESYEKNIVNIKSVESQIENISFTIDKAKSQQQQKQTKIIDVANTEETIISVNLEGKYSQLISFLSNMKKLSRFNIIKNLSIQGAEGESEAITISLYVIIFSKSGT